jgi:carbon-monoxide dehydrogenase large subunit
VNAVSDALSPFGVDHVDMPLRAERVWDAVDGQAAADGGSNEANEGADGGHDGGDD